MKAVYRLAASALAVLAAGCSTPRELPTVEVARRDFAHRVMAEGFLRSRQVAEITVPAEMRRGARILWIAEDGSEVAAGDPVLRLDQFEMKDRLEEEEAELASADVERRRVAAQGRSAVASATTRRDLAGLELEHAERFRRQDLDLFSRTEIVDSEIREEMARERRKHAEDLEGIHAEKAEAAVEVVDVHRRRAGLGVEEAREALRALEIRAPVSGVLIWARDWQGETPQIGEQVFRGQTLGAIPDMSDLEAEVFVLESDAGGLAPGATAEVLVEAHPETTFQARVKRIDPVAKRPYRGSPVQYFGVVLELERVDRSVMKAGQRVKASLVVDEWRDALLVPRQALYQSEGSWMVYAASRDEVTPRQIEIEALTPALAVVASGLDEGERIALEKPAAEPAAGALEALLAGRKVNE